MREVYVGEFCTLYLHGMNVITVDENNSEVAITAMRQGLILEIDQDNIYLGTPDGMITATVSHDLAKMIEIEFIGEQMDQDLPQNGDEVH